MKIIIAPDSFKDGLSAKKAALTIYKAFKEVNKKHNYQIIPISDGGEGLLETLTEEKIEVEVTGPLNKPTKAALGFLNNKKTIVVEMALAAGLEKVERQKRNPLYTTTYGVGELIIKALTYNPKTIILGLGGSATNDLGLGALKALGLKFYTKDKKRVGILGKDIFEIASIDKSNINRKLMKTNLILATDVTNILTGKNGATYVFGSQKGLLKKDLNRFDEQFKKISNLLNKEFNSDFTKKTGAGAAGGLAYSMATVFKGKIVSGFEVVEEELKLKEKFQKANILITGEGKIDDQTLQGKGPFKIVQKAKEINPNIKTYVFVGTNKLKNKLDLFEVIEINEKDLSLEDNLNKTESHLYKQALKLAKKIL